MRTRVSTLAFLAALAAPSGAVAQGRTLTLEVEAREIAFARTMSDRDFEAFLTFVSPEAVFFDGSDPLRGRDAIASVWRPYFQGPDAPFSWRPDVVQVLDSGTLALTSGPVLLPDGRSAGRFNSIWRRDPDGVWRVIFDRGS